MMSHQLGPRRRSLLFAVVLTFACVSERHVAAQKVTINSETSTYDFHPTSSTTSSGSTWYAWHGYADGRDRIFARRQDVDGGLGNTHTLSQSGVSHGPPTIVGEYDDSVSVVWSRKNDEQWQVVHRCYVDGSWTQPVVVSDPSHDAIYATAVTLPGDSTAVAWSAMVDGSWRVRCRQIKAERLLPIQNVSEESTDAFRPELVRHNDDVWTF